MNGPVLEIVEFRTSGDSNAFLKAASAMDSWLKAQPGYKSRRLVKQDNDGYIDIVEWADMASAKAAADNIMTAAPAAQFMAFIVPQSVVMRHAHLVLSQ